MDSSRGKVTQYVLFALLCVCVSSFDLSSCFFGISNATLLFVLLFCLCSVCVLFVFCLFSSCASSFDQTPRGAVLCSLGTRGERPLTGVRREARARTCELPPSFRSLQALSSPAGDPGERAPAARGGARGQGPPRRLLPRAARPRGPGLKTRRSSRRGSGRRRSSRRGPTFGRWAVADRARTAATRTSCGRRPRGAPRWGSTSGPRLETAPQDSPRELAARPLREGVQESPTEPPRGRHGSLGQQGPLWDFGAVARLFLHLAGCAECVR